MDFYCELFIDFYYKKYYRYNVVCLNLEKGNNILRLDNEYVIG